MSAEDRPAPESFFIAIDPNVCVGVGKCEILAPDAVTYDEDLGVATANPGVPLTFAQAEDLLYGCPSGAISIIEIDETTD